MAIIYSYPKQTTPNDSDSFVITDSSQSAPNKNRTKSLTVGDLASYVITSQNAITGGGTLNTMAMFTPDGQKIGNSFMTYNPTNQFFVISKRLQIDGDIIVDGRGSFNGDYLRVNCALYGASGVSGTAGQVLSSTGTGVEWISDGGGTVTGTGTPNTLTMWSTGGTGIEDSIVKEVAGTAYATTKNLVIDGGIYQSNTGKSVIIGELALQNGTSGTDGENVALGYEALKATTTGTNNIAIGSETLKTATIGKNNIAIGKKALEVVTTDNNIALGFNALNIANVGNDNVVIGSTNLQNTTSTSVSSNVVIGKGAGNLNTITGSFQRNIVLGAQALQTSTATTINNSIFMGLNSGKSIKGSSSNDIGIGQNAFYGTNGGFDTGGFNIAIGLNAQGSNTANTKYSIKIGSDQGTAASYATNVSTVDTTFGSTNNALGKHSAVIGGYANSASGDASFIGSGHGNTIAVGATGGAILGGFDNDITGVGSAGMALGSNLNVAGANQVVAGRYNVSNINTKFIVGAGFSDANRKNAFEVMNTSQIRLAQYPSNFPPTAGANDIDLLVLQPNGFVYRTPSVAFQNGATYQPSLTLTCSAGGSTFEGPNIARFTKLTWTGADGGHSITLPDAGDTTVPVMSNRLVEYLTDGTFSAARSVDFTVVSGGLINGITSRTITGKYQSIKFWSDGTEWYILNQQT